MAKAKAATQRAETAAEKAEKAAKRPGHFYLFAAGFLLALVGAVMAFALDKSDASVLGVSLEPLGGVLVAAGALLLAGAAIISARIGGGTGGAANGADGTTIKAVGGLIAVLGGVIAVTALTIVTLARLGSGDTDSMVAVTSSAFGIISAVIGAYLGIRVSSEAATKSNKEAKNAAVAEHEATLAKHQVSAIEETVKENDLVLAGKVNAVAQEVRDQEVGKAIRPSGESRYL